MRSSSRNAIMAALPPAVRPLEAALARSLNQTSAIPSKVELADIGMPKRIKLCLEKPMHLRVSHNAECNCVLLHRVCMLLCQYDRNCSRLSDGNRFKPTDNFIILRKPSSSRMFHASTCRRLRRHNGTPDRQAYPG